MRLFRVISLMGCKCSSVLLVQMTLLILDLWCRHVDLKGNLIKAMMVMNWLNMLEVEKF